MRARPIARTLVALGLTAAGFVAVQTTAAGPASADTYSRNDPWSTSCTVYNEGIDVYKQHDPPYAAGRIMAFCTSSGTHTLFAWIDTPTPNTDGGCVSFPADHVTRTFRANMLSFLNFANSPSYVWRYCHYDAHFNLVKSTVGILHDDAGGGGGGGSIP